MKKVFSVLMISITSISLATATLPDTNENTEAVAPAVSLDEFFSAANTFFKTYVADGKVDYAGVKAEGKTIAKLAETVGSADLSSADNNTKTAFYINAYNLLVIKSVTDNLPINSPLDVAGFFDTKKHNVAGAYMTLNDIENKKLRPDPRVHFVLVCAAKGCPRIINEAYLPSTVQDQMTRQTKKAMNDGNFIRVDATAKTVKISQIFEWYKEDFVNNAGTALAYINKYRETAIPSDYKVSTYEYDWTLNKK